MAIKLDNTSEYIGSEGSTHYWNWSLFVVCSGKDSLEEIKYVEYHLHPTFENSVVRRRSAKKSFALDSAGWGIFEVEAYVVFKDTDRKIVKLKHMLHFEDGELT